MKTSELISELALQIAQHGDLPIKVQIDGAYQGQIDIVPMIKGQPDDYSFLSIYAYGGFSGEERKGGGEEGFYSDLDE